MLVGAHHAGVDPDCPFRPLALVGVAAQLVEDSFPDAVG
jgi:hypothetical protein